VAEYLLELYVSRSDAEAVRHDAERARRAAVELTGEGTPVHYVRSIFVPEDETCFLLYQADSIDAVRLAAGRAGLGNARIRETTSEET
jgi:hypothetical protein